MSSINSSIKKFNNSEVRIVFSPLVEAANPANFCQKSLHLVTGIIGELDWWRFPKVWRICDPVLPKDLLLIFMTEKKTREVSDMSLPTFPLNKNIINQLTNISFYLGHYWPTLVDVEFPFWLATSTAPSPERKHALLRLACRWISMRIRN